MLSSFVKPWFVLKIFVSGYERLFAFVYYTLKS